MFTKRRATGQHTIHLWLSEFQFFICRVIRFELADTKTEPKQTKTKQSHPIEFSSPLLSSALLSSPPRGFSIRVDSSRFNTPLIGNMNWTVHVFLSGSAPTCAVHSGWSDSPASVATHTLTQVTHCDFARAFLAVQHRAAKLCGDLLCGQI